MEIPCNKKVILSYLILYSLYRGVHVPQFQKISIPPLQKGQWKFQGGGGGKSKSFK